MVEASQIEIFFDYLERIVTAVSGVDVELEELNSQMKTIIDETKCYRR